MRGRQNLGFLAYKVSSPNVRYMVWNDYYYPVDAQAVKTAVEQCFSISSR